MKSSLKHFFLTSIFVAIIITSSVFSLSAQISSGIGVTNADRGFAEEEFRRGVQAFYRGSFNDSILQFEKALSYLPDENLIIDWLGKAYYKAGIEGAAITQWQYAVDNGYGGILLANKLEIIQARRVTGSDIDATSRFTEAGSFLGVRNNELQFAQPVSVLPNSDGTCWVLAYTSNELLLIDINGTVISRVRGPITGFDRPMDLIRLTDGNLLVSEYYGDRLSLLDSKGRFIKSFGSKGRDLGQFVGPQYLATSDDGSIYVTDFGNNRVNVFDKDGVALFSFGNVSSDFSGFKAPTGIAIADNLVYVVDAVTGGLYQFDKSGNYLGIFVPEDTFKRPEALRLWGDYLIVSDTNRVVLVSLSDGSIIEKASTGNAPTRITCAVPDINGNLLATDFISNEVYIMAKMTELVGGLFVQIERVISDNFPQVVIEVSVENRNRESVVGLKEVNFLVTEEKRPASAQRLTGMADTNSICDVALVIDRSLSSGLYNEALESAVKEIATAMNGQGTLKIICAGSIPAIEFEGNPTNALDFNVNRLVTPVSQNVSLDLALRLAVNSLIPGEKKRAVIILTGSSDVSRNAFSQYGLADVCAYMNNNAVQCLTVSLSRDKISPEVTYITEQTKGSSYYVFRAEGISSIINDILDVPSGMYQLTYTSSLPTNFGQAYLPVEVEAYLFNRSGRDETGYFAPLE